jgi:putative transposase
MSGRYKLKWLCEALLVSRSGYYGWLRRRDLPGPREQENAVLRRRIREEFLRSRETYGSPRLARVLAGLAGRHRIARLMREQHLRARQRSKYKVRTTDSRHDHPIAPNRLQQRVPPQRCNEVWVTDATGVLTGQGWQYVVALLDLYSRRVVGWSMDDHLDAAMAVRALQMAIAQRRPPPQLIVHSDRGTQFASAAFRTLLAAHGFIPSMSRPGNCYDNAHIESFWSSLKYELVYHRRFATKAEVRSAIFDYIEAFYNRRRLHSSLGYVSPVTFETEQN